MLKHRTSNKHFGRNSAHCKLMFRNMAISLIEHNKIKTTLPKAKELRKYIEPLITVSKTDSVSNRRYIFDSIRNINATKKLFSDIGPGFKNRNGGYLRILKCGFRKGDSAPMALIILSKMEEI